MTQILDLSAVLDRDTVKLADGKTVDLRNPAEFGPLDEFRLRGLLAAVTGYDPSKIKSEEDAAEVSRKLHDLAAMIVVDPPEDLDDGSCAAIFGAWIGKHAGPQPADPPRPSGTRKSTGARSSQGSKRSTAATPKRGSTSRSGR